MQQTAYNNYDPRPMPTGTDLMPRATADGVSYFNSGIPDKFIAKISQFNDRPFLGGANFPNKSMEVLPCMISPALNLDRTYGEPPVVDGYALTPSMGIARNQPRGLATDPKREALFRKKLLPPPMNNNTKNFGA